MFEERPGFESYNMMNFSNPGMPLVYPNVSYSANQCSNVDNRISKLETELSNLQSRVSRLEGNIYPQAVDYNSYPKTTYQNSMNMM